MQRYLCIFILLIFSVSFASERKDAPNYEPTTKIIKTKTAPDKSRAACDLQNHYNVATGYATGQAPNDKIVTYIDPSECGAPTYPFEITALSFSMIPLTGNCWPVTMDIVVFAPTVAGDNCSAPDVELYRQTVLCDSANWAIPNIGTEFFTEPFCVDGPFFIGVEYGDTTFIAQSYPSLLFDTTSAPDTCDNWYYFDIDSTADWHEWYAFWSNLPGYPWFWIEGETNSSACVIDTDEDGIEDSLDNCPLIANPAQEDADIDGVGDSCDNCVNVFNDTQTDSDGDGIGDSCDVCPNDHLNDSDSDGVCESVDNCPGIYNPLQEDSDFDGRGDACENCCQFIRGNIDNDAMETIDIADLVFLVDYMFGIPTGPQPPCLEEADVDGNTTLDIADLVYLVDYMFGSPSGPAPTACP